MSAQPTSIPLGIAGLLDPSAAGLVAPRHAGRPDPRWVKFKWRYTDTELGSGTKTRMRLYYYEGEEWAARYGLPEIRREIDELRRQFDYAPSKNFSYLLFASHRFFRQTNLFFVSEGVQGVTSTQEPVMAVPYWGEVETFRHISTHEMVHQFQIQKMNDVSEGRAAMQSGVPLWFIEGMAEYYSLYGMDAQSRHFIRDLLLYPDEKRDHKMRGFFEEGPPSFLTVYKLGQAKMDFLEAEFGKGTIQKLLDSGAKAKAETPIIATFTKELNVTPEELEERWRVYLEKLHKSEADTLRQDVAKLEEVKGLSDRIDHYDVSPDGTMVFYREIDELTGETSLKLLDLKNGARALKIDNDNRPGALTFYFMQLPVLAIGNERLAYVAETSAGPELEIRGLRHEGGDLKTHDSFRIQLHRHGLIEASTPAISPDGTQVAFVGVNSTGHQNLYRVEAREGAVPVALTEEHYSVRDLSWSRQGILFASDRATKKSYGIYLIDPESKGIVLVRAGGETDQLAPDGDPAKLVFQSWSSGSSQIHLREGGREFRLTEAKTALMNPKLRGDSLYAIGFRSGRFHLFRIPAKDFFNVPVQTVDGGAPTAEAELWKPQLATILPHEGGEYAAFRWSNIRIDQLMAFFASGSALGIGAHVSDLMRDYGLGIQFVTLGSWDLINSNISLSSRRGRWDWIGGFYLSALPRIELDPENPGEILDQDNFYLNREIGLYGGFRYPFSAFGYGELLVATARVKRATYVDPITEENFSPQRPGGDWLLSPTIRFGHDRIAYEAFTGPFSGWGVLLESALGFYTDSGLTNHWYRLDGSYYQRLFGPTVLAFEAIGGISHGDFVDPFYVSSDDILRAYSFGDRRLIGTYLVAGRTELRFPIGTLFKFPYLRGMVGADLGSVFNAPTQLGTRVASSGSLGILLNLPPLSIGFIWSSPIRVAPGPREAHLLHFTLRYLYF